MLKSHKRSCTTDEAVDVESAAKLLGVSPRSVRNYVDRGILRRLGDGSKILVSLQDIYAAASTLSHCFDFTAIARAALRALVSASRAERRLDRLELLLGVDSFVLGTEEQDVMELYKKCRDLLTDFTEDMKAADVLEWSRFFAGVTEEYLELVEMYTGDQEPWVPYMEAAQKLYDSAPRDTFRQRRDLEVAYAYVSASRLHLRQVAYFYIRRHHGKKVAGASCPETVMGERDSQIIDLIFSMQKLH